MSPIFVAISAGIISMIGWGLADVFAKKGIDKIGYHRALVYIQATGLTLTIPLIFLLNGEIDLSIKNLTILFVFATIDIAGYLLLYKAYEIGKVSILNPITSTWAVLAALVSFLFFGEVFNLQKIIAFILVMVGVILSSVDFKELRDGIQKNDLAKGVPLAILVFILYGVYIPMFDKYIESQSWIMVSLILQFFKLVTSISYSKFCKKTTILIKNKKIVFWLIVSGLLEGMASLALTWGLSASTETSITSAISSAYPLVVVIAAYLILKEKVAKNQYAGIALITLGAIIMGLL